MIAGGLVHRATGGHLAGARVVLRCDCDMPPRELVTDEDGLYAFRNLSAGQYTVTVMFHRSVKSKHVTVLPVASYRVNFSIDGLRECRDGETPVTGDTPVRHARLV
nr:carboxypeptidase-like regulatory domain-containing protein [Nannocystis sp.]